MAEALRTTVQRYRDLGVDVVIVQQPPQQKIEIGPTVDKLLYTDEGWRTFDRDFAAYVQATSPTIEDSAIVRSASRKVVAQLCCDHVQVIDMDSLFKSRDSYLWADAKGSFFFDKDHLWVYGARMVQPLFSTAVERARGEGAGSTPCRSQP